MENETKKRRRPKSVLIYVSAEQHAKISALASEEDLSVSKFLFRALKKQLPILSKK